MKGTTQQEDDDDDFNIELWRATKKRVPEPVEQPQKRVSPLDGKRTVKYKEDPLMDSLIHSILRESDKFPDEV
jgi:hypothetical protein